jgi:hypothetical protein
MSLYIKNIIGTARIFSQTYHYLISALKRRGDTAGATTDIVAMASTDQVEYVDSIGVLDDVGLMITPMTYDTGEIFAVIPTASTNGDMTFTRASTATRINESGVLESSATGVPRIDYTDGTACLLVEPTKTNYITYSNEFENVAWVKTLATITDNNVTGIDGTTSASLLNDNNSGGTGGVRVDETAFVVQSGDNVISIYAKKGTLDWLRIQTFNYDAGGNGSIDFDLDNGVLGTINTITGSIESAPNGFYKCSVYFNTTSDLNGAIRIWLMTADNTTASTPLDGTSNIYITSAQQEAGTYGTSYIPTSGATATRATETGTGCGTSAEFNSEAGVFFVETANFADDGLAHFISLSDGTPDNAVRIRIDSNSVINRIAAQFRVGGINQSFISSTSYTITDFNKIAFRWAVNDFSLWIDGVEVATDVSGSILSASTLTTLSIDNSTSEPFYGKIRQIQALEYLTDTEMINLTT